MFAVLALAACLAAADDRPPTARARALFDEGVRAAQQGDSAAAHDAWVRAFSLAPDLPLPDGLDAVVL